MAKTIKFNWPTSLFVKIITIFTIFMSSAFISFAGPEDLILADLYYSVSGDTLTVQGYAPNHGGVESALVQVLDSTGNVTQVACVVVTQNIDPEFYATFMNVSTTWAIDSYQIVIDHYKQSVSCTGTEFDQSSYTGYFDLLLLNDLLERVSNLEDRVEILEENLEDLNESMQEEISNLQSDISSLEGDLSSLETEVSNLEAAILDLEDRLNVGTINLRYKASTQHLDVWGKAPQGATSAVLTVRDTEDDSTVYITMTTSISSYGGFENSYKFTDWNGNSVDVSSLDPASYNIRVSFTGLSGSYMVDAIFTNLELEGIQESLSILYNEVDDLWIAVDDNTDNISMLWLDSEEQWISIHELELENSQQWDAINHNWRVNRLQWFGMFLLYMDSQRQWRAIGDLNDKVSDLQDMLNWMNHATINLKYSNKDARNHPNTLRVWGEAPLGAEEYKVLFKAADGSVEYSSDFRNVIELGDNENSFNHHFNLDNVEKKSYNVIVRFFTEEGTWMRGYNVGDTFTELESLGVRMVNVDQKIHLLGEEEVTEYIAYSIKTDETIENARIVLRSTNTDPMVDIIPPMGDPEPEYYYTVLRENQYIVGSQPYYFTSDEFTITEGLYELEIVIETNYEGPIFLNGNGNDKWVSESFTVEVGNYPENGAFFVKPRTNWRSGMSDKYYPGVEEPPFIEEYDRMYWHSFAEDENFDLKLLVFEGTSLDKCEWWYSQEGDVSGKIAFAETYEVVEDLSICYSEIFPSGLAYNFEEEGVYEITGRADFGGGVTGKEHSKVLGVDNTKPEIYSISPEDGAFSNELRVEVEVGDELSGIDKVYVTLTALFNVSEEEFGEPGIAPMRPPKDGPSETVTKRARFDFEEEVYYAYFRTPTPMGGPVGCMTEEDEEAETECFRWYHLLDGEYNISVEVFDNAGNSNSREGPSVLIDNTAPEIEIVETNFDENTTSYEGDVVYIKVFVEDNLAGIDEIWLEFEDLELNLNQEGNGMSCELTQVDGDELSGHFETGDDCRSPFFNEEIELEETVEIYVYATDLAEEEPNMAETETSITLIDPILDFESSLDEENETCVFVSNFESDGLGNEWITVENECDMNASITLNLALDSKDTNITVDLGPYEERSVFMFNDLIISAKNAVIINASYNETSEELEFTADGEGTQEVMIYVNGFGKPTEVYFDGSLISNWTYSNEYVYATVEFGSPHTLLLSWYEEVIIEEVSPKTTSGGGGGGGSGFTSFATRVLNEEPEPVTEVRIKTNTPKQPENVPSEPETVTVVSPPSPITEPETPSEPSVEVQEAPGLAGYITANVPTVLGTLFGLLIIAGIFYLVLRKRV